MLNVDTEKVKASLVSFIEEAVLTTRLMGWQTAFVCLFFLSGLSRMFRAAMQEGVKAVDEHLDRIEAQAFRWRSIGQEDPYRSAEEDFEVN